MGDNPPEERRLILIGTTGSGKSASGNTILDLPGHFLSKCSARSVTQVCQLGTSEYHVEEEVGRSSSRSVVVVDLPGFGGTNLSQDQITTEVRRCVVLTVPGPHAFLLVVPLGRYTEEDHMAVTGMAAVFGEAALRNHTVVLFTRGDELEEPMEEYLASAPAHLKTLIDRCGGRYHVLNNRAPRDVEQVHKLLRKVEQVVDDNGGGCYTNAMYLEVEAARREEEDRLRREEEEDDRLRREKEEEDRLRREEDRLRREEEDRLRREEEDKLRRELDRLRREEEDKLRREEDRLRREEEDRLRREEDRLRREEEDRLRREKEEVDRLRREVEDRLRREEDRLRREDEDRLRREDDRLKKKDDKLSTIKAVGGGGHWHGKNPPKKPGVGCYPEPCVDRVARILHHM
ncbi:GTPase IMAP family member 4 [Merluccius polli]|uniref:GTPase IMAP family member 4 n=1 Tax=Merluccius polli TaxID=89951 RepID=A0AA47NAI2_MERPO|nr:GTPase IMAP family member 4 [Merluccius polli]